MLIQTLPPRLILRVIAIRAASIWRLVTQPASSDFRPYSPKLTREPPFVSPLRRPRCTRRNLTRRGRSISSHPPRHRPTCRPGRVGASTRSSGLGRRRRSDGRCSGRPPGRGRGRRPAGFDGPAGPCCCKPPGPRPPPGPPAAATAAATGAATAAGPTRTAAAAARAATASALAARTAAATATPLRARRAELALGHARAAAATPRVDLAEPRRLAVGALVALGHDLALVDPDLHADAAVGHLRLGEAVVDVRAQRVQRDAALGVLLRARHLRAAQAATALDLHALRAGAHGGGERALHRAPERHAVLQLLGDRLRHQLGVELGALDLVDVDLHGPAAHGVQLAAQRVDLDAGLADHDARAAPCRCRP